MRLRDYPYVVVRFACRHCPRVGRYRVAVLAERYGADVDMEDVLEAVSSSCRARSGERGVKCGAYFPDLPPEKPPDLPRSLLPRERLKIIRGAGVSAESARRRARPLALVDRRLDAARRLVQVPAPFHVDAGSSMYVAAGKRLTHRGAKQMAATAVAKAEQAGIAITVAVADAGGHLMVLERMDGGRFHTVHSSTTKAVCAASNKRPTTAQGAQAQPLDVAHAIGLALAAGPERWTAMEGGFPVIVDGECIGGIGVSGGDWETDARIAREAISSIDATWSLDRK